MAVSFDERAALDLTAARAIESSHEATTLWTDDDRAWASRAAAEIVGQRGAPEAFLVARARLVLERVGERFKALSRAVATLRWRPWIGVAIAAVAFAAGVATDQIGGTHRINLLALPFFGVLAWNVAVYALLAASALRRRRGEGLHRRPLRALLAQLASHRSRAGRGRLAAALARFAEDWSTISAPLYAARAARILHVGAATFAIGLLCGLYLRGLVFEYRAGWESTFLSASAVHALLALVFAPASALTGIPVPSTIEVEAIRAPADENAARWLHLMAATVALVVVVPRLALALAMVLVERHRGTHVPIVLDEPYFARLLRGFRGGSVRVDVVPYSYTMSAAAAAGLERLLRSAFGTNAALTIRSPIAYGGEDALAANTHVDASGYVIALFNATATPERETHGAFLGALAAMSGAGGTLLALIDIASFRERWAAEPKRLDERRASWRALCEERRIGCVFAELGATVPADAVASLERALEGRGP
jgi:uncharacterized protein DUF2868